MWLANRSRIEHFYSFLDQRRCRVRINDFMSMTVAVHAKYRTICCLRTPSMSGGKFCIFGRSDRRNPIMIDRKRVDDFSYDPLFIADTVARQSLHGKLFATVSLFCLLTTIRNSIVSLKKSSKLWRPAIEFVGKRSHFWNLLKSVATAIRFCGDTSDTGRAFPSPRSAIRGCLCDCATP